ncbi:hypothetical protein THITH_09475 [Thioalkalivibrio paradoxus ARh 1]|uniref:Uncharacterized protein n=1 Tax=Thioalkalivibrio paradoxus ARh 1 TaxID=713585 RepID=W0DIK8_9GAMM|nr:hypothetical protein THITH_09475 [Thioalkalivibrio paradoxus ARh 1]
MSGWGCPHEARGECQRVPGRRCEPGMKGCVLAGRFLFSDPDKNTPRMLREKGAGQQPVRQGPRGRSNDSR